MGGGWGGNLLENLASLQKRPQHEVKGVVMARFQVQYEGSYLMKSPASWPMRGMQTQMYISTFLG